MTTKEIRENLCFYDERNPDNAIELMDLSKGDLEYLRMDCKCDNCFSGRAKLAERILKMQSGQCQYIEQFDYEHETA